ncbi:hypothetical protein Ddc_10009 [Ditylenchus destructor]|nr:hypothetical protein Ddc_10009 [Ditylenchus destructor]
MSEASFVFNFNPANFSSASQDFPKSNVVELERSKWYLGIEKAQSSNLNYSKVLDIFLTCERGATDHNYLANLTLILRGSVLDLHFSYSRIPILQHQELQSELQRNVLHSKSSLIRRRIYYFEPMDLEMPCLKIDYNCILDEANGFINEKGECEITAEISVDRIDSEEEAGIERIFKGCKDSRSPPKRLDGVINLQGHRVRVNKEVSVYLFCIQYFKNIFTSFSGQKIFPTFTRTLYKHIYVESVYLPGRYLYTDGVVEFRLKSKDDTQESQKLWTLADVRENVQQHTTLQAQDADAQAQDDSGEKSSTETLSSLNDVVQKGALRTLEWFLGSCVSAEYEGNVNLTVSAENIEDLLSVGSYFQISKIMDTCKEFLSRKYDYADLSVEDRIKLVKKYNLTSVTVPSFLVPGIIPQDRSGTEMLVNVNFLDTGKEEMCSVTYESMQIKTLYQHALTSLYSTGLCDAPSQYKLVNVRYSNPSMGYSPDSHTVDVEKERSFIYGLVWTSRLSYSFEVRQLKEGEAPDQTDNFSTSLSQSLNYLMPRAVSNVSSGNPSDSNFIEILVQVNFLDTGNEEMCSVRHYNYMTIRSLLYDVFQGLYKNGKCEPKYYRLEKVHISDPASPFSADCQTVIMNGENPPAMYGFVQAYRIYSFEVRLIPGQDSEQSTSKSDSFSRLNDPRSFPQTEEQSVNATSSISNDEPSTSYQSLLPRSIAIAREQSTSKSDSFSRLNHPKSNLRIDEQSTNVCSFEDLEEIENFFIERSIENNILVRVTFLDTGLKKTCTLDHYKGMLLGTLFSKALLRVYVNDMENEILPPREYELENVRMFYPGLTGNEQEIVPVDVNDVMSAYVLTTQAYSFDVRRKVEKSSIPEDNASISNKDSVPGTSNEFGNVPDINPVNPLKHQWNTDSAWLTPTVLVQFTFLDTGEERVCSVKFIDGMTVQTLLFNAFIELNYKRDYADCFRPSEYKVENMRISDPETYWEVEYQSKAIDDNPPPALMLDYAHSSRIYNFELRRIQNQSIGTNDSFSNRKSCAGSSVLVKTDDISPSTSSGTGQQLETVPPAFQFSISNEEPIISGENPLASTIEPSNSKSDSFSKRSIAGNSALVPSTEFDDFCLQRIQRKKSNQTFVQLAFLDSEEEKTVTIPYTNRMAIQQLFSFALLTISASGSGFYFPFEYEIVTVHACEEDSTSEGESLTLESFNIPVDVSGTVNSAYAYRFQIKRKTDTPSTSKDCQRPWKLIKLD